MAKKRTKKQKKRARQKQAQKKFVKKNTVDLTAKGVTHIEKDNDKKSHQSLVIQEYKHKPTKRSSSLSQKKVKQLMMNNPKDVWLDLRKTVIVSIIIGIVLTLLFFLLK